MEHQHDEAAAPAAASARTAPPSRRTRKPSLSDVAAAAGVSPITASRVANGKGNVEPSTRSRVLAAMHQIGYQPNLAARALATGRFSSIGVVTFSLAPHGNSATIQGIHRAAGRRGCSITLMGAEAARAADVEQAVSRLTHHGVDGVIVLAEQTLLEQRPCLLPAGVPHVIIDAGAGPEHDVVDSDQRLGAELATTHLLDLGHPVVHHLRGPEGAAAAAARAAAYVETHRRRGLEAPAIMPGDWSSRTGVAAAEQVAARYRAGELSAVFVANDAMALGLLHGLHRLGIEVPQQVSVVGYDDVPGSEAYLPGLTTVRQHFDEVGRIAVERLLDRVDGLHHEPARVLVPVELVVRDSTRSP